MTILVFGKSGQVASYLKDKPDVVCLSRQKADLSNCEAIASIIETGDYSAVINAAAYTDTNKAETDEALATLVNGDAPAVMARVCAEKQIPFVHISTDYVFSGVGEIPWRPQDPISPLNAYGRSKAAGEQGIIEAGSRWTILRTSSVFSPDSVNFVTAIAKASRNRDELRVVDDQVSGLTHAKAIADTVYTIVHKMITDPSIKGIYHYCGMPHMSWADAAQIICNTISPDTKIIRVTTQEYGAKISRPLNSRLDCQSLIDDLQIDPPNSRNDIIQCLAEMEKNL